MFETFVFNLGGGVREETLDGRPYLVADCVMGVEGVLHGSNGPGFYPSDEWRNAVPSWNMKPITNDHPTKDGKPCSAATPEVITNKQLGFLLNTRYDNKLRTEAWFDAQKTRERCPEVYGALKARRTVEVSTGLFVDQDKTAGDHKGRKYDWVARNHRPDHLAVLPGKVGACSIADGAGLLANEAATIQNLLVANEELGRLVSEPPKKEPDVEKKTMVDGLIANGGGLWSEENREWLMGRNEEWLKRAVAAIPTKTPPAPAPAPAPTPAPVANTVQQWLAESKAPPEVVYLVNSAIETANAQKAQLVANIMASPLNKFSAEFLNDQRLEVLQGIEAMIPKPTANATPNGYPVLQPNYAGQGGGSPTPLSNAAPVNLPALQPPTLNFGAKK